MMSLFRAGCTLIITLIVSQAVFAQESKKTQSFSSEQKAVEYLEQQKRSGNQASLSTEKQSRQRFTVYLKGYRQWSVAFKQAQSLEKMGYQNVEVVKDRFERGYSIIVSHFFSKSNAGKAFNKLRSSGIRNVKVKQDTIQLKRYIVSVSIPASDIPDATAKASPSVQPGIQKKEPESIKVTQSKDDDVLIIADDSGTSEDVILVMSDSSDISYEIEIDSKLDESNVTGAIDKIILEEELFTRSSSDVTNVEYIHISSHVNWRMSENWDMQLAARLDGYDQHGKHGTDVDDVNLDYEDTYLRFRNDFLRLTLGTQTIRWGRVDVLAPTDNMVTLDLSRGVLPNWDDLYRASPAVRAEWFSGKNKIDFVYLPRFREAELPDDKDNVWYPINTRKGEILGGENTALSRMILKQATIDDDIDGEGGLGIRFSSNVNSIDYAVTLQRVRLSAPSYKMNEQFRQDLLSNPLLAVSNQNSYGYTYTEEHPRNWVLGADMAFQWQEFTLRFEGAWFSDLPATTESLEYKTYDGLKWAAGVEFYPGDADTRVILQLSGSHIDEKEDIVDRDNSLTLSGESETLFLNNRWRFNTKFSLGLDIKDIYISPEISYLGWEPFEIYSAAHYLDGNEQSLGGFYQENSMITFGWRGRF